MSEDFLITSIIKGLTEDKSYAVSVTSVFEDNYFDDPHISEIFNYVKKHISKYNSIPERDIIIGKMPKDIKEDVKTVFKEIDSTDFSVSKNYDWLLEETNKYLKDRAIKQAILKGIDIIDTKDNYSEIKTIIENALCKDLKVDIGSNYFKDMAQRLKRIFNSTDNRIKTYYYTFDELFNGGFPPYTLNMILAKVHGHKCVCYDTIINVKINNEYIDIKIGDLYKYLYVDEHKGENIMNKLKGKSKLELFTNKYGNEEGKRRYECFISKLKSNCGEKGRGSLQWYTNKYGKEEGKRRYDEKCKNIKLSTKGVNSLQWYTNKYGKEEGKRRYDEKCKKCSEKGRGSLQWYTNKYGKEEGKRRYDEYVNIQKKTNTLQGYIDRYGKEKGTIKWNKRCTDISHRNTLQGYIDRYGKEKGTIKYNIRQEKWKKSLYSKSKLEIEKMVKGRVSNGLNKGYSKLSQDLFDILYQEIKNDFIDIRYATLNRNGEKLLICNDKIMLVDFYIGDKKRIIEFDGVYWHNEDNDKKRDDLLKTNGYDVLRITDIEYKDCDASIKKCLEFIYK